MKGCKVALSIGLGWYLLASDAGAAGFWVLWNQLEEYRSRLDDNFVTVLAESSYRVAAYDTREACLRGAIRQVRGAHLLTDEQPSKYFDNGRFVMRHEDTIIEYIELNAPRDLQAPILVDPSHMLKHTLSCWPDSSPGPGRR